LNRLITYFFDGLHGFEEGKLLRKLLAVFAIYKAVFWIVDYKALFSEQSMVYRNDVPVPFWQWPAFLLFKSHSHVLPILFLGLLIAVSLYVLFSERTCRLAFFILWIIVVNIINHVYCATSAGDMLFQHFLFFCIFLSDAAPKASELKQNLDSAIHNTGIVALRLQVCIVYFYAALAKLSDQDWINGDAVNIIGSMVMRST
jgi:hypothetical protein